MLCITHTKIIMLTLTVIENVENIKLDIFNETPGVSTGMVGVFTEMAGVFTGYQIIILSSYHDSEEGRP